MPTDPPSSTLPPCPASGRREKGVDCALQPGTRVHRAPCPGSGWVGGRLGTYSAPQPLAELWGSRLTPVPSRLLRRPQRRMVTVALKGLAFPFQAQLHFLPPPPPSIRTTIWPEMKRVDVAKFPSLEQNCFGNLWPVSVCCPGQVGGAISLRAERGACASHSLATWELSWTLLGLGAPAIMGKFTAAH